MTILQANLKHLYQRRSFLLLDLFLGVFAFSIIKVVSDGRAGSFSGFIVWMFIVGLFVSTLPIDVLTKPFSYCLPGHNKMPRKFLFCVGLTASLWSAIFLLYPASSFARVSLTCISVFFIGTIFYWLGVWIVFRFRGWNYVAALIPLVIFGGQMLDAHIFIEHIIVNNSFSVIVLGALVNLLAWLHWGRDNLARKYCGKMRMGAFDAWDKGKISKYQQAILAEKDQKAPVYVLPKTEAFFISRISGAGEKLSRYIWGGFYKSFGVMMSQRNDWIRFLLVCLLPLLLFFGYIGRGGNIIFAIPGFMVLQMSLHVRSPLLINGGRRERFWTALSLAYAVTLLITVLVTVAAIITLWLKPVMPELAVKGHQLSYHALNIKYFFLPAVLVPITFTLGLIFYKKPIIAMIVAIAAFQATFIVLMSKSGFKQFLQPNAILAVILLLLGWTIFIAVLRYICMKCSLVK